MSRQEHFAAGAGWQVQPEGPHPFGGEWASLRDAQGNHVGQMRYETSDRWVPVPGHVGVQHITVDPEHRGRGGAQALYRGVHEATGKPFLHVSDEMTPEAKRAVAKSAAANPGQHKVLAWKRKPGEMLGERVARAYPKPRKPRS